MTKRKLGQLISFFPPRMYKSCPRCTKSLSKISNDVCPNPGCNEIVNEHEKVDNFVVVFVFDENVANK